MLVDAKIYREKRNHFREEGKRVHRVCNRRIVLYWPWDTKIPRGRTPCWYIPWGIHSGMHSTLYTFVYLLLRSSIQQQNASKTFSEQSPSQIPQPLQSPCFRTNSDISFQQALSDRPEPHRKLTKSFRYHFNHQPAVFARHDKPNSEQSNDSDDKREANQLNPWFRSKEII